MSAAPRSVFDFAGSKLTLGDELGRGGEGVVYDLPTQPDRVAKLYHAPPDAAKQRKLRLMADSIDSPLRNYAAWPEATLHLGLDGPVLGFTMQRIEKRSPIHMLYSPAQRRETFPNARFDFLVFAARNIAAAFETLHAHGHVLGDVNQGNVLVGEDSRVILIDCDSFQIQVGDALHRCEVGVAHFTPPELQAVASFEDITRTPNHDGFGLALLIFHLLMGGRHPYSGVPLAAQVGESLEGDIRDFRYAYATDAARRLIAPPPKSVPLASLPPEIVALFEQAFTECGVEWRPTAQQWVGALDALRAELRQCAKQPLHLHGSHLAECPWCVLDRRHVTLFGELSRPRQRAEADPPAGLDLEALQVEVARMNLPEPIEMPQYSTGVNSAITGGAQGMSWQAWSILLFTAGAVGQLFLPKWLWLPMVLIGFVGLSAKRVMPGSSEDEANRLYEQQRFERLREQLRQCIAAINATNGTARVGQWRSAVRELRQHGAVEHGAAEAVLQAQPESGLRSFLGTQRIARLNDSRISTFQRVLLDANGFETAADLDPGSLNQLSMVDADARAALLEWRSELVRTFRRRKPVVLSAAEREHQQRWRNRQRLLEAEVLAVFESLKNNPPQRAALPTPRAIELQALKGQVAKAHVRCQNAARNTQ